MSDQETNTARRLPPEQRRAQLARAALALAAEQGHAGLSLDDVAERAGVTRNLLYHYFPRGRLDVFLAALERAGDELTGDFIVDPDQPLAPAARSQHRARHRSRRTRERRLARVAPRPLGGRAGDPGAARALSRRDRHRHGPQPPRHADPPPLARVALRAYLDFHQTALDEWRDSGLDRAALLALLERTLTATIAAIRGEATA